MRVKAVAFHLTIPLVIGPVAAAWADPPPDTYLNCSAIFLARAEYNEGLGVSDPGHVEFLKQRSNLLLRAAEAFSPLENVPCSYGSDLTAELVLCRDHPQLVHEMEAMVPDRLLELVAATGGDAPLPVCIEDGTCSTCLQLPVDLPR